MHCQKPSDDQASKFGFTVHVLVGWYHACLKRVEKAVKPKTPQTKQMRRFWFRRFGGVVAPPVKQFFFIIIASQELSLCICKSCELS